MKKTKSFSALLLFVLIFSFGCQENRKILNEQKPNYENSENWVSVPDNIDKAVDVFYVYPTVFSGTVDLNMNIEEEKNRARVQNVTKKQGGVFMEQCNFFAPYYRQMSLDGLTMPQDTVDKYFSIGYADVKDAFNYYLKNYNNGRPFIFAGHSQGTMNLINIMKERFDNPELNKKLVAAYLIGYSVTLDDLAQCSWMKIAEKDNDIGVIITYNTQSEDASDSPVLLADAQCVNPLNWTRLNEYAPKEMNHGAAFFNENGEIDSLIVNFTDARINEIGALIATTPDVDQYSNDAFPRGVFHVQDYYFFYNNLKENVGVRVNAYINSH